MDNQPQQVPIQQAPATQPSVAPVAQQAQQPPIKKRNALWLWITLPVLGVLAVLAVLFFIFMYPDMNARSIATRFMNAAQSGDDTVLNDLSGDTTSNSLLKSANEGLQNATFSVSDSKNKGSDGYVVNFKVEGSSTIKNTSVILKDNKVSTFLLNVGVSSSDATKSTDSSITTTTNSKCLTVDDLKNSDITYIDKAALKTSATSNFPVYFDNLYFGADSTDFRSEDGAKSTFEKAATLYKNNSSKDYTFILKGYEHNVGATSDMTISAQRAQKAKTAMVALGIPESRITVQDPESVSSSDPNYDEIDRKIAINILIPSTCANAY